MRWSAQLDFGEHEDKILPLLSLVVSALVGLFVVVFLVVTESLGEVLLSAGPTKRMLSPLLGSLIGGYLLFRFFPDARGSGIPQTRIAIVLQKGIISLRTVIGKFVCSSISLGSGVALGREGPAVQIGAGIASLAGRKLGLSENHLRSLIPVGTAAAVAAAFNTPLAAVLFTLEEILADLHARVVGSVVIGAATSWIVLRLILGDEPLFHVPAYQLVHPLEFLVYACLGLLGGVVSTAFVKLLLWQRAAFMKVPRRFQAFSPAAGGLVVGLLALSVPGVLGVGYNLVGDALNGQLALKLMLILLVVKMVATTVCYGSGNAGGIFGPSLFIGAMLGGSVGHIAHLLMPDHTGNSGAYALVGMGAAFAGIVRTPMTSVIMIFEVTRDYTIIVPLMIANLCSYFLAQKLQRMPIYEALSLQDGIAMPSSAHRPEPIVVERAMRPLPADTAEPAGEQLFVYPDEPLDLALQRMGAAGIDEIRVLNRVGSRPIGVLTAEDAIGSYRTLAKPAGPVEERPSGHWLPALAVTTIVAVLIVSGLVVWQRSRRFDRGLASFRAGESLFEQGLVNEAVSEFRKGLALTPQDSRMRAALGLALVQSGHFSEATAYLKEAARADSTLGPVWLGLAKVERANGEKARAADLLRRALSGVWPGKGGLLRRSAEFEYAELLDEMGHSSEAVSTLLAIIPQSGDNPATAKKAADAISSVGSREQAEEAFQLLARMFPSDISVWMRLGDTRFAAGKDRSALDAYQWASDVDGSNSEARVAVLRVQEVLRLDPTRAGLSVRERARRWDEVLSRVVAAVSECGDSPELGKAKSLLGKQPASIEALDARMEAARVTWQAAEPACKGDVVLTQIMSRLRD